MKSESIINLINKLNEKTITGKELEQLKNSLDSFEDVKELLSSMNQDYLIIKSQLEEYNEYSNQKKVRNKILETLQEKTKESTTKSRLNIRWISLVSSIAASLILIAYFFFSNEIKEESPVVWETIQTRHGERKYITLADGTIVKLNGNSKFSYTKTELNKYRIVKLYGEAYFEVAEESNRPFYILSKNFVTQVIGTKFNIDSDIEKSIEVNSGIVQVFNIQTKLDDNIPESAIDKLTDLVEKQHSSIARLTKGQKALLDGSNWKIKNFHNENWHNDVLVYLNEPMDLVLKKAYRYYGDSVRINPTLANQRVSISFKNKSIEKVLHTLTELTNTNLTKKSEKLWEIKIKN